MAVRQLDVELSGDDAAGAVAFGAETLVLSNGNYVVSDPYWDDTQNNISQAGLVVLYDGGTDAEISRLYGGSPGDFVGGGGLFEVGDGNVLVASDAAAVGPGARGALTWIDGETGLAGSGEIGTNNSLYATGGLYLSWLTDELSLLVLTDGNVVAGFPGWVDPNSGHAVGAARWIDGNVGATGTLSASNAIVGTQDGDGVGWNLRELSNGNYVVGSHALRWPSDLNPSVLATNAGGVTVAAGDGSTVGTFGHNGVLTGFVGGHDQSQIGNRIIPVEGSPTGDFLIGSHTMSYSENGVQHIDAGGIRRVSGTAAPASTIVLNQHTTVHGSDGDNVGLFAEGGPNGGFWTTAPYYDEVQALRWRGAVTRFGPNQTYPVRVSPTNSVVGEPGDELGSQLIVLDNGNAVVGGANADRPTLQATDAGVFLWLSGAASPTGTIFDPGYSPVRGTSWYDYVGRHLIKLGNNYLVLAGTGATWNTGRAYFGDGSQAPPFGTELDETTSVSGGGQDGIGLHATVLSNGNVVLSWDWWISPTSNTTGATMLVDPTTFPTGLVSSFPKVTLSGWQFNFPPTTVHELSDGSFVIQQPRWTDHTGGAWSNGSEHGRVTWHPGTHAVDMVVSTQNSIIGKPEMNLGDLPPYLLPAGDYVVFASEYDDPATAPTRDGFAMLVEGRDTRALVAGETNNFVVGEAKWSGPSTSTPGFLNSTNRYRHLNPYPLTSDDGVLISTAANQAIMLKLDQPPTFVSQPVDVEVETATNAETSAVVSFATPAAADRRDGTVPVSCSPGSGNAFPIGTTTVTCTATDGQGQTASVAFEVTVTPADRTVPDLVPIAPARLVDTRSGEQTVDGIQAGLGRRTAGTTLEVEVLGRGGVPVAGVSAVALNIIGVQPDARSFLTVYPCGSPRPNASAHNSLGDDVRANELLSRVGADGKVCVYTLENVDLVVDVTAYVPDGSRVMPLAPARLVDTRPAGETADGETERIGSREPLSITRIPVAGRLGVPTSGASAVVLNVTAVGPDAAGFLTLWPCGSAQPLASGLNYRSGDVIPNEQIVALDSTGDICVFTRAETHLVVDLNGYVSGGSDVTAVAPERLLETRAGQRTVDGLSQAIGSLDERSTIELQVAGRGSTPAAATGATLNVAAVDPAAPGFITVYPCDGPPPVTSSLNYAAGQTIANEVVVDLTTTGSTCLFTSAGTDVIADITSFVLEPS